MSSGGGRSGSSLRPKGGVEARLALEKLGLNIEDLQAEAEITTATPRRPAGEFSALTAMQSNMHKAQLSSRRQGKVMSNAESMQRRMMDDTNQDVQEGKRMKIIALHSK